MMDWLAMVLLKIFANVVALVIVIGFVIALVGGLIIALMSGLIGWIWAIADEFADWLDRFFSADK